MDESEQRQMADGLVCGLVLKKAVDLETKAKIESSEEENKLLRLINQRYAKAADEAIYSINQLNYGMAVKILRTALFATMPENPNE